MKIAFNPSTVAALIAPPNNKDITFDLRGQNIFARGVKFCGTDTNTWRDIKINNVSIGSNILDLRNGSNTTLTNTNGVVTINSTWRPVVDNLTSDSTTSSLSAKQGKVLKSLIDGKSDSGHNHDDRYLKLTGGTLTGNLIGTAAMFSGRFYGNGDDEGIIVKPSSNGYAGLILGTHNGERSVFYFTKGNPFWRYNNGSTNLDIQHPKKPGVIALTSDIPTSLKNPYSLTTFGVVYDGSAAKVVSPSNFISQVNEATSTVTDGTMFITSWASNNGFADTNAVNVPYKRKAIHLWEYIKTKTDSLYATKGHNHDDRYLKLTGGTMSGTIYRNSGGSTISGRDHAIIRQTYAPGGSSWNPIACVDTETGTWTLGHLSSGDSDTNFHFCFSTNADYNAGNNNGNYVTLRNKVGTIALLSEIPDKNSWNYDDRYLKLTGGTMNGNARIGHGSGNLYIGNSGNDGWLAVQDICSQDSIGDGKWSIRVDGTASFQSIKFPSNRLISQVSNGSNSPLKGIKLPNLLSNAIGIFSRVGNGADEGGIVLSEDTCVIYNSFDTGWGLSVRDKDKHQTDISEDDTIAFGVRQDYRAYSLGGFEKSGSDNSYVLLGGGGHKLISDFSISTHTHGLLHSDLTVTLANTTTDSGWSMINSSYNGFLLKSIRTQGSAPNWIENNYAAGICFGGADTKGVVSVAYGIPYIKFAGGNGSKPAWWIRLSGISGATYNLANFNADTLDGYHANGLFTALSNSNNGISITVGGTTKSVSNISVNYASSAGNADTVDYYHADSLFRDLGWWTDSETHDANDITGNGAVFAYTEHSNVPNTGVLVTFKGGSDGYRWQMSKSYWSRSLHIRQRNGDNGTWSNWLRLLDESDLTWNNIAGKPSTFNPAAHTHIVFNNNLMIKGTNGVSDSASIHLGIGDSDTGFKWISDGKCQIYANNVAVGEWTSGGMNWFKNPTVNGNKVWNAGNDGSGSGLDADTVDGYHASSLVKFYLSPMDIDATADSAKSWFVNTLPSSSGAIVYNVPGSEKTIIAGKSSSGAYGHMLQLNYDNTYLKILRYKSNSWKSTDWEKISAGYADSSGNTDLLDGYHASGLFTNLSNLGNNISITIGGTNKTLTVGYASTATQVGKSLKWTDATGTAQSYNGGTEKSITSLNFPYNQIALNFRHPGDGYATKIQYMTAGNEALVFAAQNSVTSFIFKSGADITNSNLWYDQVPTPTLQLKGQSAYINKLIANGSVPAFNFLVNGSSRFDGKLWQLYSTRTDPNDTCIRDSAIACFGEYDDDAMWIGNNTNNGTWIQVSFRGDEDRPSKNYLYNLSLQPLGGNVGIGTTSPVYKLHVNGNIYSSGQIIREGYSTIWAQGRNVALLRETSVSGYHTLWSLKTTNGSWDFGEYNTSGWNNVPVLSYITDSNYNSGNNVTTYQIKFPLASGTVALTSYGGDSSHPIFLGYLDLEHGNDGTVSSSFSCLGYTVPFTYTRGGNYCRIYIPDTTHQTFYIRAAIASVNYSGGGMDTWVGVHRGDGAWWLHCYASGLNEVRVKGFHQRNSNNDSWWGGNPLWSGNSGANRITVCIFGNVTLR